MTRRRRGDHIVLGPEPHFATCLHCRCHLPMLPLPAEVPVVVGYMQGFIKGHAGCKPRPAAGTEGTGDLPAPVSELLSRGRMTAAEYEQE